jgi:hypothetical protein
MQKYNCWRVSDALVVGIPKKGRISFPIPTARSLMTDDRFTGRVACRHRRRALCQTFDERRNETSNAFTPGFQTEKLPLAAIKDTGNRLTSAPIHCKTTLEGDTLASLIRRLKRLGDAIARLLPN